MRRYQGSTTNCQLVEDVYITVTGTTTGVENNGIWDLNIYVTSGTTCNTGVCTDCDFIEINDPKPIKRAIYADDLELVTCTYIIPNVKETDVYDIIISDAANCEQKFRIEGLQQKVVQISDEVSGYTINPKVQYKTSFDYEIMISNTAYENLSESNKKPLYRNINQKC